MGNYFQNPATPGGTPTSSPPGGADPRALWHTTRRLTWHCPTVIGTTHPHSGSSTSRTVASHRGGNGTSTLTNISPASQGLLHSHSESLPRAVHTDPFRETVVRLEHLRDISEKHPTHMAGDLLEAPVGLSLRHLSKKLTRSIHSKAVSELWQRRTDLEGTLRRQWLRKLPGDSPAQPDSYHRHVEWFHCLPGKWETTLLDPVFRLGLCQRLGYPAPGTGQRCGRTPPGVNNANASWILMGDMQPVAPKVYTPDDVTGSGTLSPSLPGKPVSQPPLNRPCWSLIKSSRTVNLPKAVSDPSIVQTSTSLSPRGPNCGWTSKSPQSATDRRIATAYKPWTRGWYRWSWNNLAELAPGHRPSSTGSSIIGYNSLSDKACHFPMPRGLPAPTCGDPYPAHC